MVSSSSMLNLREGLDGEVMLSLECKNSLNFWFICYYYYPYESLTSMLVFLFILLTILSCFHVGARVGTIGSNGRGYKAGKGGKITGRRRRGHHFAV